MRIITKIAEMKAAADAFRREGKRIGFVPTMGFLHDGHLSLMRKAREENEVLIVSIFVNPTQFGPSEDLDRYPRDAEGDRKKCEAAGVTVVFSPETGEMYPEKPSVFVNVEGVSDLLEGAVRPGHFRGVATIVTKLFHIVKPHQAYFGQKDFQQCCVIMRMAAGLNLDVQVSMLPTVREQDGLAMSSRNSYLSAEERRKAPVLYRALIAARELYQAGTHDPGLLQKRMAMVIQAEPGVSLEYAEAVHPETLIPVTAADDRIVLLVAARIGKTRLLDNLMLY